MFKETITNRYLLSEEKYTTSENTNETMVKEHPGEPKRKFLSAAKGEKCFSQSMLLLVSMCFLYLFLLPLWFLWIFKPFLAVGQQTMNEFSPKTPFTTSHTQTHTWTYCSQCPAQGLAVPCTRLASEEWPLSIWNHCCHTLCTQSSNPPANTNTTDNLTHVHTSTLFLTLTLLLVALFWPKQPEKQMFHLTGCGQ